LGIWGFWQQFLKRMEFSCKKWRKIQKRHYFIVLKFISNTTTLKRTLIHSEIIVTPARIINCTDGEWKLWQVWYDSSMLLFVVVLLVRWIMPMFTK
jgi:hypothetical protein